VPSTTCSLPARRGKVDGRGGCGAWRKPVRIKEVGRSCGLIVIAGVRHERLRDRQGNLSSVVFIRCVENKYSRVRQHSSVCGGRHDALNLARGA
jgi:hypothetical protein